MSTSRKTVVAWAMYDFANSAYATSVLSVIFSVYFASVIVPPEGALILGVRVPGESLWGYLISAVMASVILLSPVLGHAADVLSKKKQALVFWALIGALSAMALIHAEPGHLAYACLFAYLGTLGYEMSLVFYNAFLNDISDERTAGRISGLGFALGYVGGGLCLALNLVMIKKPELFGIASGDMTWPIRVSIFVVGLWWLGFSIPTFIELRDKPRAVKETASFPTLALRSIAQMKSTLREIFREPRVRRFLMAYLIYDDGVQTILLMASIFGAKALNMSTSELAMCYLAIQFVAFVGALACGHLADHWSHKKVIMTGLVCFGIVTAWAVTMHSASQFWVLGLIVGLIMGGVQAASRSLFSLMIPAERSAEYFSIFSIVGKATALIGPFVFGLTAQLFGLRPAVAAMIAFFVVGGIILNGVQEPGNA